MKKKTIKAWAWVDKDGAIDPLTIRSTKAKCKQIVIDWKALVHSGFSVHRITITVGE